MALAACGESTVGEATISAPHAQDGQQLEPGTLYQYPLSIHCDMDWLTEFNGEMWKLEEAEVQPRSLGPYPDGWPMHGQSIQGLVRLVDGEHIEYSIPSVDVIAVYAPTDEEPPGCV